MFIDIRDQWRIDEIERKVDRKADSSELSRKVDESDFRRLSSRVRELEDHINQANETIRQLGVKYEEMSDKYWEMYHEREGMETTRMEWNEREDG